jgi:hypothetical protein
LTFVHNVLFGQNVANSRVRRCFVHHELVVVRIGALPLGGTHRFVTLSDVAQMLAFMLDFVSSQVGSDQMWTLLQPNTLQIELGHYFGQILAEKV